MIQKEGLSSKEELDIAAFEIRCGIIREIAGNHGGHIGGSLDLSEMLAVVYSDFLRVDPSEPDKEDRDFMIFSKGHAGPALYSALACRGFFPKDRLDRLNKFSSELPGHCDRNKVPGVDATTGSLGQGLSIACGAALGAKIKDTDQRIFCVIGDGESDEGQIWEAAQAAAHFKLDNLITFLDWNKMQIDGTNDEVMLLGDPVKKFSAFGWNAELVDGSDTLKIQDAVRKAVSEKNGRPSMIVLDTKKGYGIECVSSLPNNHCIGFPDEMVAKAMKELKTRAEELGVDLEKIWGQSWA
ncbi:MAG: transketolase [Lachnospiraceae bacterium]|nr:transketolase [Lachnospiraceae bacterium]